MSCQVLLNIAKNCDSNVGGLKELNLIRVENLTNVVITNGIVTGYTTVLKPVSIHLQPGVASYQVEFSRDDLGVPTYAHSVNFRVNRRNGTRGNAVERIAQGGQRVYAIVKDANGIDWLVGYPWGLVLTGNEGGSGLNKSDGTGYNITLEGEQDAPELQIQFV